MDSYARALEQTKGLKEDPIQRLKMMAGEVRTSHNEDLKIMKGYHEFCLQLPAEHRGQVKSLNENFLKGHLEDLRTKENELINMEDFRPVYKLYLSHLMEKSIKFLVEVPTMIKDKNYNHICLMRESLIAFSPDIFKDDNECTRLMAELTMLLSATLESVIHINILTNGEQ